MQDRNRRVVAWSARTAAALAALAISSLSHAGVIATAPDFSGSYYIDSPDYAPDANYSEVVATFNWSPSAQGADTLQISGAFGIAQPDSYNYGSANSSLYANGILVATCDSWDACWSGGKSTTAWSFDFTAAEAASFDGQITLVAEVSADQPGYYIGYNELSELQVSTVTAPVPEPLPVMSMLGALGAFGVMARRRRARRG